MDTRAQSVESIGNKNVQVGGVDGVDTVSSEARKGRTRGEEEASRNCGDRACVRGGCGNGKEVRPGTQEWRGKGAGKHVHRHIFNVVPLSSHPSGSFPVVV